MKIIGLMGYAGSGKDTAAAHMPGWHRLAFADKLKRDLIAHCIAFYRVNPVDATPEQKALIRPMLVAHGRIMRDIDPDWWVKALECDLHRLPAEAQVIITDVRYPNECTRIRGLGGVVVYIRRPGVGAASDEEEKSIRDALKGFLHDATVANDGTPNDLSDAVHLAACKVWDERSKVTEA